MRSISSYCPAPVFKSCAPATSFFTELIVGQRQRGWSLSILHHRSSRGFSCLPILEVDAVLNYFFLAGCAMSAILLVGLLEVVRAANRLCSRTELSESRAEESSGPFRWQALSLPLVRTTKLPRKTIP